MDRPLQKFMGCILFYLIWQIYLAWTVALLSRVLEALSSIFSPGTACTKFDDNT